MIKLIDFLAWAIGYGIVYAGLIGLLIGAVLFLAVVVLTIYFYFKKDKKDVERNIKHTK